MDERSKTIRWGYLALGTTALLFAGVIYAWSILKAPLGEAFGWTGTALSMNYTITMWCFCLGGFTGGLLSRKLGSRICLFAAAVLSGSGFLLASRLTGADILPLYLFYGAMGGLGIGLTFNVIVSTVSGWFPDKRGLCSGVMMMGFGTSALVVGKLAAALIEGPGWRTAYACIGVALAVMLSAAALVLKPAAQKPAVPIKDSTANSVIAARTGNGATAPVRDYSTGEMLRRPSFWLGFFCIVCMSAVGSTVLSFARDMALNIGAGADLATSLVGVLSISNGFGRILFGALFDRIGRRGTMLLANFLTIAAALVMQTAMNAASLSLFIAGLCLVGISYGSCPTISSTFTSSFYGAKYFSLNFSVLNFSLIPASAIAVVSGSMVESTGGFAAPLLLLLVLSVISLVLDFCIRKP